MQKDETTKTVKMRRFHLKKKPFLMVTSLAFCIIILILLFLGGAALTGILTILARSRLEQEMSSAAHWLSGSDHQQHPCQINHQNQENGRTFPFTNFNKSSELQPGKEFWKSIKTGFSCPKTLLRRLGSREFGRWTCGLRRLKSQSSPPCVIYSFGVSNDSQFEERILKSLPLCQVYAYRSIGYPLKSSHSHVHLNSMGTDGKGTFPSLKTLMAKNGGHCWIDALKMDVEGEEFGGLDRILDDFKGEELPVGQLLLQVDEWEMTGLGDLLYRKSAKIVEFLKRLENRGLRLFNYKLNMNDSFRQQDFYQFSFINTNAFSLNRFLGSYVEIESPEEIVQSYQLISDCGCSRKYFYSTTIKRNGSEYVEQRPRLRSSCSDPGTFYEPIQKVVSFSMWFKNGDRQKMAWLDRRFQTGLQLNLEGVRKYYPGYTIRIYTDVPLREDDVYCNFLCENSDLFWCDVHKTPSLGNMSAAYYRTWRFLPLGDETVDHFLSRDLDSAVSAREQAAVKDWLLKTTKAIHVMRDHPAHYNLILAGMWGASNTRLGLSAASNLSQNIFNVDTMKRHYPIKYDQWILQSKLFNPSKSDIVAHDSYFCKWPRGTLVRPFPNRRSPVRDFVGNYYLKRPRVRECPKNCRPSYGKDWKYC